MARAKVYRFSDDEQRGALMARALGHPARIRILEAIRERRVMSYNEIVRLIPLARGTMSQHIAQLNRVDLITAEELSDGRTGYALNNWAVEEAYTLISGVLAA
ncbi:MAG: helix-turn-helix domain-containing protein [Bacteroidota bacterium]